MPFSQNPLFRVICYTPLHFLSRLLTGKFWGPMRLMVEISNECNLNCPICYWRKEAVTKKISHTKWENTIEEIVKQNPGMTGAAWLGGEPMLEIELIEKLSQHFFYNVIITNGTLPLLKMKRVSYWISVDGTKEFFEKQRGPVYDKIKKNIMEYKPGNIVLKCVISKINQACLEDFVAEWSNIPNVKKIFFSFYTPTMNEANNFFCLSKKEKVAILNRLKKIKLPNKKFIGQSIRMLELFLSKKSLEHEQKCEKSFNLFLNSEGEKIAHQNDPTASCAFRSGDCRRCGNLCAIASRATFKERDFS